jgi:hypothetical protein
MSVLSWKKFGKRIIFLHMNTKSSFLTYLENLRKSKSCKLFWDFVDGARGKIYSLRHVEAVNGTSEDQFEVDSHSAVFKFAVETCDELILV